MKNIGSGLIVAAAWLAGACGLAAANPPPVTGPGSYGQLLVAQLATQYPDIRALALYITLPGGSTPESIASSDGARGSPPPPAAAQALATWRPHFAYDQGSRELSAAVPMLDMSHKRAGVMTLVLRGRSRSALQSEALSIRDELARRTSYAANLVQEAVDDPNIPLDSYAQHIVDDELARHRDLMILAIHATTPRNGDPEILASNIGRIGKKADDDDMRVVRDGKTNLEVNKDLMRYEVELPLQNAAGQRIGALGVVFALTPDTNQKARHAEAIRIRDEIAHRIPSAATLVEPDAPSGSAHPLSLLHRSDLPGYDGDLDHLFADVGENKLFVAAEDHGTVEVFNLKTGEHLQTLTPFKTPHAFFLVPGTHRLVVTDDSGPRIIDDRTYQVLGKIDVAAGADTEYYDASTGHLFIVSGGGDVNLKSCWLNEVDPATGRVLRQLKFASDHVEAVQAEQHGDRLFINIADRNEVDVVDKNSLRVVGRWPISGAATNLSMALDEPDHRLFIVTRMPTQMFALNTDNGHIVAAIDVPAVVDGVYFDALRKRIYVPGAVGEVGVYQETDPDHYREIARVPSAPGGKSELFVSALNELFVAISPRYNRPPVGAVLWYRLTPVVSGAAAR
jgi:hypothetical protein